MRKLFACVVIVGFVATVQAGLIDTFEGYTAGNPLSDENPSWLSKGDITDQLVAVEGTGNQYYANNNTSGQYTRGATIGLGNDAIADGTMGYLSFRVMATTNGTDSGIGLVAAAPANAAVAEWEFFGPYISVYNGEIRLYNGVDFDEVFTVTIGGWHDVRMDIYNDSDTFDLWVDGGLVDSGRAFRNNAPGALQSFKVLMNDSNSGDIVGIDDIIVRVPEPATLVLLGLGGLLLSRRK